MGAGSLGAGWDCRAWRVHADVVLVVVVVSVLVTGANKGSERVLMVFTLVSVELTFYVSWSSHRKVFSEMRTQW